MAVEVGHAPLAAPRHPIGTWSRVYGFGSVIVAGFAAATLVSGWASDETSGRLEMLLATPLARAQWAIRSGLGALAAIALITAIIAAACVVLAAGGLALGGWGMRRWDVAR